jgi:hypothetical protein
LAISDLPTAAADCPLSAAKRKAWTCGNVA